MSLHESKSGRTEVRWREGSRNRSRTFDRKRDAEDFERAARRKSQLGEEVPSRIDSLTLEDHFLRWLKSRKANLSPRTHRLYGELFATHVVKELGYVPLAHLTHDRLEDWLNQRLTEGAGTVSMAKTVTLLSQVFTDAQRKGKIRQNPAELLQKPKQRATRFTPATPRQVEAIRAWFIEREKAEGAVLVSVLAYGGLRVGEALALRWEDLKLGKALWVERSLEDDGSFKSTKNEIEREVELPEIVAQDLLQWRNRGERNLIFPRADGGGWTKSDRGNWRRRYFDKAKREAGWDEPLYKLRHSCASLMIAAGMNHVEVADHLGHKPSVSVGVYQRQIREMKGQPVRSVDEMIAEARERWADGAERPPNTTSDKERLKGANALESESEKSAK